RFLLLPNSVGKPESVETPEPFGPRKRVHSCAEAAEVNRKNANKKGRQFMALSYDARHTWGRLFNLPHSADERFIDRLRSQDAVLQLCEKSRARTGVPSHRRASSRPPMTSIAR